MCYKSKKWIIQSVSNTMQNCISDEDPDQQATGLFNTQKKSPNSYSNVLSKSGHYPLISKTFSSIPITNNTLPHPQCLTPVSWPSSCSICRQAYTSSRRKPSHYVNKYRIRALPSSTAAAAAPFSSSFFFFTPFLPVYHYLNGYKQLSPLTILENKCPYIY